MTLDGASALPVLVALVAAFMYVCTYIRVHQTRAMDATAWEARWGWREQIRVCALQMGYFSSLSIPIIFTSFIATKPTTRCTYSIDIIMTLYDLSSN